MQCEIITNEQIVEEAKNQENSTRFGEIVNSPQSIGVSSPYGVGFIEGAEWCRKMFMEYLRSHGYNLQGFEDQ